MVMVMGWVGQYIGRLWTLLIPCMKSHHCDQRILLKEEIKVNCLYLPLSLIIMTQETRNLYIYIYIYLSIYVYKHEREDGIKKQRNKDTKSLCSRGKDHYTYVNNFDRPESLIFKVTSSRC